MKLPFHNFFGLSPGLYSETNIMILVVTHQTLMHQISQKKIGRLYLLSDLALPCLGGC